MPRRTGGKSPADFLDLYLKRVKEELGLYTGRVFWTGNGVNFTKIPLGKNMIGKIPSEIAKRINIENPDRFTFHSFRRSAATAVADVGATSAQMCDFFGWANSKMAGEYISTSKAAVQNVASKLQGSSETKQDEQNLELSKAAADQAEDIWDDWTPTDEDLKMVDAVSPPIKAPIQIGAGAKVFFISNIQNFHC